MLDTLDISISWEEYLARSDWLHRFLICIDELYLSQEVYGSTRGNAFLYVLPLYHTHIHTCVKAPCWAQGHNGHVHTLQPKIGAVMVTAWTPRMVSGLQQLLQRPSRSTSGQSQALDRSPKPRWGRHPRLGSGAHLTSPVKMSAALSPVQTSRMWRPAQAEIGSKPGMGHSHKSSIGARAGVAPPSSQEQVVYTWVWEYARYHQDSTGQDSGCADAPRLRLRLGVVQSSS